MKITRRDLGRLAVSAFPAGGLFAGAPRASAAQRAATPDSRYAGVQVGMNVPYNFGSRDMDPDDLLDRCLALNVSVLELRSQPVERFLGSPAATGTTPSVDEMRRWRAGVPVERAAAFRKKYESAGVAIDIVKYDGIYDMSDAEVDYCFALARTLGARAISCEIDRARTQGIGRFADRHKLKVAYHGHEGTTPAHWEAAFGEAAHHAANLDIGHFVAGNNMSPVPFLKEHHARITHVHVKDRKMHDGPNVPFGEGDTPIIEVLQLIRDNRWPIQATIEFEYPVPGGSDRMTELARCLAYCRKALV